MNGQQRIWFTSDLHFGHQNIITYCGRPWKTAQRMDEALIENWNARVGQGDLVYVLGDVFWCEAERAAQILRRLNGHKKVVLGNHDQLIRKDPGTRMLFDEILPDLHEVHIDRMHIVLCHYPLLSWNRAFGGAFMLHGHSHNTIPFDPRNGRRMDVGVDAQGYAPVSWHEVKSRLEAVPAFDPRGYERDGDGRA